MKLTEVDMGVMIWGVMVLTFAIGLSGPPPPALALANASVSAPFPNSSRSLGVYLDHRGDGAIEFNLCNGKLCGHVVWVREGAPAEACGTVIIGDAALMGVGVWDGGWIFDPEFGQKFDVEVTHLNDNEIQVMGYLGSKDLSETFVWKKAPTSLKRCPASSNVALAPAE